MTTITKKPFGITADGAEASLYVLSDAEGIEFSVTDFGANIVGAVCADAKGVKKDVILGYESVAGYEENPCFFGACIGPSANRIGGAKFSIDGKEYSLAVNDGPNNLHSDKEKGFHKRMWKAEIAGEELKMTLSMKDGDMGFPGNLDVCVTYSIEDKTGLKIHYFVKTDRPALINMTNHSYFNLAGHNAGLITDHVLKLNCSRFTPVVEGSIPTGELAPVAGTVFDFTSPRRIGQSIDEDNDQLKIGAGYDHNWVVDDADGTLRKIAELSEPTSGRRMEVFTTQPGVQFYAGNCMVPQNGKEGAVYDYREGMCLETQVFPNSINQENFPNAVYTPEKPYDSVTVYRFSAE